MATLVTSKVVFSFCKAFLVSLAFYLKLLNSYCYLITILKVLIIKNIVNYVEGYCRGIEVKLC